MHEADDDEPDAGDRARHAEHAGRARDEPLAPRRRARRRARAVRDADADARAEDDGERRERDADVVDRDAAREPRELEVEQQVERQRDDRERRAGRRARDRERDVDLKKQAENVRDRAARTAAHDDEPDREHVGEPGDRRDARRQRGKHDELREQADGDAARLAQHGAKRAVVDRAAESGHQHEEQHEIQCSQKVHLSSSRSSGSALLNSPPLQLSWDVLQFLAWF